MSLDLKNVSYIYKPGTIFETKALEQINLRIEQGEFIGIIGHTGSGKSTLIQHLNGLLRPSKGMVSYKDKNIFFDRNYLKYVRSQVGLVFQYPEYQLFEATVYDDIAFGPKNMNLSEEDIKQRVARAIDQVGLSKTLLPSSPFSLSGGQKRRVAIAGVLAMEPEILVLDEPCAGLDPSGRKRLMNELKNLNEKNGITIVLISHNMEEIASYVKRLIVMNEGKIVQEGTPKQIFENIEFLESMDLGVPQIRYLMNELMKCGISAPQTIFTVKEAEQFILHQFGQVKK